MLAIPLTTGIGGREMRTRGHMFITKLSASDLGLLSRQGDEAMSKIEKSIQREQRISAVKIWILNFCSYI